MQNKKLYLILAVAIVIVAAAAFVGGRLLNGRAGSLGLFPMAGKRGTVSISIQMTPAPELPKTEPDARGTFIERKDNTIVIQTFSDEMGKGGVVLYTGSSGDGGGPAKSDGGGNQGPQVEVVVTGETVIYHDATEMPSPSEMSESTIVQQVVEKGSLDDLTSDSMLMVWGRKSGDRIIADVDMYSRPVVFMKKAP
jgi:hypothetical protein